MSGLATDTTFMNSGVNEHTGGTFTAAGLNGFITNRCITVRNLVNMIGFLRILKKAGDSEMAFSSSASSGMVATNKPHG
jgi:hypothetical protein